MTGIPGIVAYDSVLDENTFFNRKKQPFGMVPESFSTGPNHETIKRFDLTCRTFLIKLFTLFSLIK
jgi:hypothetical protein